MEVAAENSGEGAPGCQLQFAQGWRFILRGFGQGSTSTLPLHLGLLLVCT